ncbi:hypothetical protein KLER11_gp51 [Pararheinheimera phage vB_PsoM_KLER1-1]|nr:hypothetical protein KLER11_gp51 [Pararheinheimera phage vB_PsoM_KLER1-1]
MKLPVKSIEWQVIDADGVMLAECLSDEVASAIAAAINNAGDKNEIR